VSNKILITAKFRCKKRRAVSMVALVLDK
jgi:hypothetical protein